MTPQNVEVLRHLEASSLTPKDALKFGCFRLAARIFDLRQAGYVISTVYEGDGVRRYARYVLLRHAAYARPTG
jgi:hypothetical protein